MKEKEVSEEAVFVSGEVVRARKRKLRSILGEGESNAVVNRVSCVLC